MIRIAIITEAKEREGGIKGTQTKWALERKHVTHTFLSTWGSSKKEDGRM